MFDYERFKTAAYRFKYETVFETENGRIRYDEYLTRVNAVYNALLRLNLTGGTVMLFARTSPGALSVALACDRAGYRCVIADSSLPAFAVEQAVKKHSPSLCIGEGRELSRISRRLAEGGCKAVLVTDDAPLPGTFPTEYSLDELILRNDYMTVNNKNDRKGEFLFAFDDDTPLPDMSFASDIKPRDGIVADVPFYKRAGAFVINELVCGCHRICFADLSLKSVKKKKIRVFVTAGDTQDGTVPETVHIHCSEKPYVGGGIFEREEIESTLTKTCPMPLSLTTDGSKIRICVTVDRDTDMDALSLHPPVQALKSVAKELLYPYKVPKTFAFTQKTV